MPRFCPNLTMMFTELDRLDRFGAAAAAGFKVVEYLFPYNHEADALRRVIDDHGLTQALFNSPPGDWDAGERGLASLPGREAEFEASLRRAYSFAQTIEPRCLHVMAGIGGDRDTYIANLKHAAATAPTGLTLLIEPINSRDMPGYHLSTSADALSVLDDVGADNLRLQLDLYHCQIMEGDLAIRIRSLLPNIGHIQIAGVPNRNEPDTGEINYPYLFDLLDELGYDGFVGCEYRPRGKTEHGLGWFQPYRERQ